MILVTLKGIAQTCGVSISTVSNILNGKTNVSEDTKHKVLEVVKQTGYQPNYFAQGMRKHKTRIIGIIVEDLDVFSTTPIVEAIMARCDDRNYRTILVNLRLYDKWQDAWYNDEQKLHSVLQPSIKELLSIKVDAMVYVAGHCRIINCFTDDFTIPALIVYGISKSPKFTSIVIDDEKGGYDVAKYLISMGHRKIGVIAGASDNLHTQKRILGFQKALFEEGVLYNPSLIRFGDWMSASGYREMATLIKEDITAVFCLNDIMAAGAYDYLYEHGIKVGQDLSLVGYDNKDISEYLRPRLTTSEIQLKTIGQTAASILLEILEGDGPLNTDQNFIKIPCKLIPRESVRKLEI